MSEKLPNRIREIRKLRGLSQEELAAKIGEDVTGATISRLETGRIALTQEWLYKLGPALNVSAIELITDKSAEVRLIPVIGFVAAGNWSEAIAAPDGYWPIPADAGGPSAFALRPKGDSMDSVAEEGRSIIIVDPDQLDLIPGRAYIVTNAEGEATFKRYRADPPRLEPDSANPEHKPIMLGREPFLIVGRVTYATHQL